MSTASAQTLEEAAQLYSSGDLEAAVSAFRRAANRLQSTDPAAAAAGWNNSCVLATQLGDLEGARTDCHAALDLREELNDDRGRARTLNNLGRLEQRLGNLDASERRYKGALALNVARGDDESAALNLLNLGALQDSRGRYSEALDLYRNAEQLAHENMDQPWAAEQRYVARLNTGTALEKLGAHQEALDLYLALSRDTPAPSPQRGAELAVNLGTAYRNLGDASEALRHFSEAELHFAAADDIAGLSNTVLNRALTHHLNRGDLETGESAYRDALELARRSGDRGEEVQVLFYLGRLLLDAGRAEEARRAFADSHELAEEHGLPEGRWSALAGAAIAENSLGNSNGAERLFREALGVVESTREAQRSSDRTLFFGDRRWVFDGLITLLQESGRGAEAFDVVQRAKARGLLDRLGEGSARPATADQVKKRLGRRQALLEYYVTPDRLLVFHVESSHLSVHSLGPSAPHLADTLSLHRALAAGRPVETELTERLAGALLSPLGDRLPRILAIAPDGLLRYLPFEMLPQGGRPLIESSRVIYLASASSGLDRESAEEDRLRFLGVAGVDPSHVTSRSLAPLTLDTTEVDAAARILGSPERRLLGQEATERALRQILETRGAEVTHVATHTLVDERDGNSALVLAPSDGDDGLLRPEEVAQWKMRGGLVVLAACQTAVTENGAGHALGSLTGAFLAGGSSLVLATLWPVADQDAQVFTEELYRHLADGDSPSEALRATKLRLLDDSRWSEPTHWAGWILVGGLTTDETTFAEWLVPVVLLLLVGVLVALMARHSGRRSRRRP